MKRVAVEHEWGSPENSHHPPMTSNLWTRIEEAVRATVERAHPGLPLTCYQGDTEELHVSWTDGPTEDAMTTLLAPQATLTTTVRHEGLGIEEVRTREDIFEYSRNTSDLCEALAAGVAVCTLGVPPLPPRAVYAAADIDPDTLAHPYPREVRNALALELMLGTNTQWDGDKQAWAALELLHQSDLTDPRTLLLDLGPEEAAQVECFATLAVDAGANTSDDAVLWAASGGWELTRNALAR